MHAAAYSHTCVSWELKFVIPKFTYSASLKWRLHQDISLLTARKRSSPSSSSAYLGEKWLVDGYFVLKFPLFGTKLGDGCTVVLNKYMLKKGQHSRCQRQLCPHVMKSLHQWIVGINKIEQEDNTLNLHSTFVSQSHPQLYNFSMVLKNERLLENRPHSSRE